MLPTDWTIRPQCHTPTSKVPIKTEEGAITGVECHAVERAYETTETMPRVEDPLNFANELNNFYARFDDKNFQDNCE